MAISCPHAIWRISPFNTSDYSVTESFKFFNCVWRWEYSVHPKDDNETPDDIVSIHLRKLTNSSACSMKKFSTTVLLGNMEGEQHAAKILIHEVLNLVSWCVWRESKSFILHHDVVQNNVCMFSLTLDPLDDEEYMKTLSRDESYTDSCLQGLSGDFHKLLISSRHSDIILKCGNREIKAHKNVLSSRSKKFLHMIENNLPNASVQNLNTLALQDMNVVVFEILICYIYTATLPDLTTELARKLYEVADEYSIAPLKKRCKQFLIDNLSSLNAIEILLFADEYGDNNMKWSVSSYIACDLKLLNSDQWKKFSVANQGLAIDIFKIFTEKVNSNAFSKISSI